MNLTRRSFLSNAGKAVIAQGALMRMMTSVNAYSQTTSSDAGDYKAMVCVFLHGGNDSNNVLIPLDSASINLYAKYRGELALNPSLIRPLAGGQYGVHPAMPNVQSLYNAGSLSFMANLGVLTEPLTKTALVTRSKAAPGDVGSHPGQTTLMQTALGDEGNYTGWGGGIAEALADSYKGVVPMCSSLYGAQSFINGKHTLGFLPPGGNGQLFCSLGNACGNRVQATLGLLSCADANPLVAADQQITSRMLDLNERFGSIVSQAPSVKTPMPSDKGANDVAQAFRGVLASIQSRQSLQANRQVFYVGLGGFDTHGNQMDYHASLLQALDGGLAWFAAALQEIGLFNNVTTFTLSDFNRTFQANGTHGCDHAWGGHHLIMGGAVKGGQVVGKYPTLDIGGPDDAGDGSGRWIPTTSVTQLGATLASWFGVSDSALDTVFPFYQNFGRQPLPLF